jgi:hypothetical protein
MRLVDQGIGEEGAEPDERGGGPSVYKVASILRKSYRHRGRDGQESRFGGNREVRERDLREMALYHQHKAHRAYFNGFMSAERQPVLMPLSP